MIVVRHTESIHNNFFRVADPGGDCPNLDPILEKKNINPIIEKKELNPDPSYRIATLTSLTTFSYKKVKIFRNSSMAPDFGTRRSR